MGAGRLTGTALSSGFAPVAATNGDQVLTNGNGVLYNGWDGTNPTVILTDAAGQIQLASFTVGTTSNRSEEIDPLSEHYLSTTPLTLVNIPTNTTDYAYFDMAGFRYFTLQIETSGAAPTDVLTVTIEGTVQDDGTAPAACIYQALTMDLFGIASVVDADDMWILDTPTAMKYFRVVYNTSNAAGNDCDLTVFLKRMF